MTWFTVRQRETGINLGALADSSKGLDIPPGFVDTVLPPTKGEK